VPPLPAAGVPESTPAVVKVTPEGRAPVSVKVGAGEPVAVTVKVPAEPAVKVVLLALVMAGAWLTVKVNFCVAAVPTPFEALMQMVKDPALAGVPERRPAVLKVTPLGSVEGTQAPAPKAVLEKVGAGTPEAVAWKLPAVPTVKVVLVTLVMAGAWSTVRVKLWVALEQPRSRQ